MNRKSLRASQPALLVLALVACQQTPSPAPLATAPAAMTDAELLAHGEYVVRIGGCNDCHTPGFPESGGQTPKEQWLMGSPMGWNGPWGTTYAANLRTKVAGMDEAAWLRYTAELHTRPPMPDFVIRAMKEEDRRAIYRFIHSLGPAGEPAPAFLPPGQKPPIPYVQWVLPPPADAPPENSPSEKG